MQVFIVIFLSILPLTIGNLYYSLHPDDDVECPERYHDCNDVHKMDVNSCFDECFSDLSK